MSYSIFKDVCVASIHFHTLDELTSRHFSSVRHLSRGWTCLSSGLFPSHLRSRGCLYPCRGRRGMSDPALHLVVPRAVPFNWSHHVMFWHWLNSEFFFWSCHRLLYLCWSLEAADLLSQLHSLLFLRFVLRSECHMILQKKCNFVLKNIISTLQTVWDKNHCDGLICVRVCGA